MSNQPEKQEAPKQAKRTHVLVRTRHNKPFRRAGVTFTPEWQAFAVAQLGRERVESIEQERGGMLDVVRCTEEEAAAQTAVEPDNRSLIELRQALAASEKRVETAETELAEIKSKIRTGAFAPPPAPRL